SPACPTLITGAVASLPLRRSPVPARRCTVSPWPRQRVTVGRRSSSTVYPPCCRSLIAAGWMNLPMPTRNSPQPLSAEGAAEWERIVAAAFIAIGEPRPSLLVELEPNGDAEHAR